MVIVLIVQIVLLVLLPLLAALQLYSLPVAGHWGVAAIAVIAFVLCPATLLLGWKLAADATNAWKGGALWTAAIVVAIAIALSPAIFLSWALAREFASYPVWQAMPARPTTISDTESPGFEPPLLAVLSDTHVTDQPATLEGHPGGTQRLAAVLGRVAEAHPVVTIIAGDLTDQGTAAEWALFSGTLRNLQRTALDDRDALSGVPRWTEILLVPGNHDLYGSPYEAGLVVVSRAGHFVDTEEVDHPYLLRAVRFVQGWSEMRPDDRSAPMLALPTRVDQLVALHAERKLESMYPEGGVVGRPGSRPYYYFDYPDGYHDLVKVLRPALDQSFPRLDRFPDSGLAIITLNSSVTPRLGGDMGRGDLGEAQLDRLEALLGDGGLSATTLVIALHHAPWRRPTDSWSWCALWRERTQSDPYAHSFLALELADSQRLLALLEADVAAHPERAVLVVHGHRHGPRNFGQTTGGVWVLEAPSVVESPVPGFWIVHRTHDGIEAEWH